ncbi:MAG: hypothetical protein AB1726_15405 [Planctomycetota bacterium]
MVLSALAPDRAPLLDAHYVLPPEGTDAILDLPLPRRVRVTAVDESGSPVEGASLTVEIPGFSVAPIYFPVRAIAPGVHEIELLPPGEVDLGLTRAGRRYARRHDTAVREARFVVPVCAAVVVTVTGKVPHEESGRPLAVRLRRAGPEELELRQPLDGRAPGTWTVRFPAVEAGAYDLFLEARAQFGAEFRELSPPLRVEVPAGPGEVSVALRL